MLQQDWTTKEMGRIRSCPFLKNSEPRLFIKRGQLAIKRRCKLTQNRSRYEILPKKASKLCFCLQGLTWRAHHYFVSMTAQRSWSSYMMCSQMSVISQCTSRPSSRSKLLLRFQGLCSARQFDSTRTHVARATARCIYIGLCYGYICPCMYLW